MIHVVVAVSVAESMNDPEKYERINFEGSQKIFNWINDYNLGFSSHHDGATSPIFTRKVVVASSAAIHSNPDPALLPLQESGKCSVLDQNYSQHIVVLSYRLLLNSAVWRRVSIC